MRLSTFSSLRRDREHSPCPRILWYGIDSYCAFHMENHCELDSLVAPPHGNLFSDVPPPHGVVKLSAVAFLWD
jgi:hypothetical protein